MRLQLQSGRGRCGQDQIPFGHFDILTVRSRVIALSVLSPVWAAHRVRMLQLICQGGASQHRIDVRAELQD